MQSQKKFKPKKCLMKAGTLRFLVIYIMSDILSKPAEINSDNLLGLLFW